MDLVKAKAGLAVINKLVAAMEDILKHYEVVSQGGGQNMTDGDRDLFDNVEKWINLISGNASGYEREISTYLKHRNKGSKVIRGNNLADITVINGDGVGKAIQLKSSNQDGAAAISGMIKEAANQFGGRGEQPMDGHRRVIDMAIRSPNNEWPYSSGGRGRKNENEFIKECANEIKDLMNDYLKHLTMKPGNKRPSDGTGLTPEERSRLSNLDNYSEFLYHNAASKKFSNLTYSENKTRFYGKSVIDNNFYSLAGVTVKIRYDFPYDVIDLSVYHDIPTLMQNGTWGFVRYFGRKWISMLAFEVQRRGDVLHVASVKTVYA